MDIISMQIANKVLKRMNTEFNGAYDIFIATEGQKVFSTAKPHDISGYTLHIYVNGYHAVSGEDYTHTNETTFEFKDALRKGDVVLATTQIVGIPRFEVTNPEYDDTSIKNQLSAINAQITGIINAMDEDSDGSIIDTIADIKKQWADADSNLMTLIEKKATTEELADLKLKVEAIKIPPTYDDAVLSAKVTALEGSTGLLDGKITTLEESTAALKVETTALKESTTAIEESATVLEKKVLALEVGSKSNELFINDEDTGRKHKIVLKDGVLKANIIGIPLAVTQTGPTSGLVDEVQEFNLNIVANADLNQKVNLVLADNEKVKLEYKKDDLWELFETQTIEALSNSYYELRITGLETGNHLVKFDILRFDNNFELGTTSFNIDVTEPPVVTELERVTALLNDSTTSEITLGEDITLGAITLGCNKNLNLNGLSARLDGATDVGTFKITSTGGGAIYFDSNFTLTGEGEEKVIIDNSDNTVSYRMGTLLAIPEGYEWVGNIFKYTAEPISLVRTKKESGGK